MKKYAIRSFQFLFVCIVVFRGSVVSGQIKLSIDVSKEYQTIHSFGASDAWRVRYVGKFWPVEKRDSIADYLFSQKFDRNGNPKGIGLSLWRFYIGAGSDEQTDSSKITHLWRRAECFLNKDGKYDWSKQEGQQWFLSAARKRGVENILGFSIAAPWFMSKNGITHATSKDPFINLREDQYGDYALFLAQVCKRFNLDYISPINEPQWEWTGTSQEGTQVTNEECARLIKSLDKELDRIGAKAKIAFGEAGAIKYLYQKNTEKAGRDNQLEDIYATSGKYSIANLKHVQPVVTSHSYWSTWNLNQLIGQRIALNQRMKEITPGYEYWQTEYCVMEKNDDVGGGNRRDLGINTALYVARIIHFDLTLVNASSWQWWTALSEADYKDGLIFLENSKPATSFSSALEASEAVKKNGTFRTSKLMWALGNYSLFVRPGMKRVEVNRNDQMQPVETAKDIMASAYKDPSSKKIVLVLINYAKENKDVMIQVFNEEKSWKGFKMYETSEDSNLEFKGFKQKSVKVPSRSIVTLVSCN